MSPGTKRRIKGIVGITAVHAVLTVGLFVVGFAMSMGRFERGGDPSPLEALALALAEILRWPLCEPLVRWGVRWVHTVFAGVLGWVPFLVNSAVWGTVLWMAWELRQGVRRRSRGAASPEDPKHDA